MFCPHENSPLGQVEICEACFDELVLAHKKIKQIEHVLKGWIGTDFDKREYRLLVDIVDNTLEEAVSTGEKR